MRHRLPEREIFLFLFPCGYATGKEAEIARKQLGIEHVFSPKESLRALFLGNSFLSRIPKDSVLLHLGGDVMYAALLARRFRWKTYAYQWGNRFWDRAISGYFVSQEGQRELLVSRGISKLKIRVVGDLMIDAVQLNPAAEQTPVRFKKEKYLVTFFPGSRIVEVKHMLPFFLRIAEIVKERCGDVSFACAVSPFLSDQEIQETVTFRETAILGSSFGILKESQSGKIIQTTRGAEIFIHHGNPYSLMRESDCLATIPGTKCGEAGFLGVPMLVLLPTNRLEEIPYQGVPELLGKIPVLGKWLKRAILSRYLPFRGFLAQPNLLAQEEIVPELVGNLTPSWVAETLVSLLQNEKKRKHMRERLKETYQSFKPAAEEIIASLFGNPA